MIVESKITGKKYQWIRVPRTGSTSYTKLFSWKTYAEYPILHSHLPYDRFRTCDACMGTGLYLNAFGVVRNPYDRFISSLYFLIERHNQSNIFDIEEDAFCNVCEICKKVDIVKNQEKYKMEFFNFYKDEKTFYEFFYDNFNKNCELKPNLTLYDIFNTKNVSLVSSFFRTQVFWAYHPKVKVFKYENINEFNLWIKNELGYDTDKLERINYSKKDLLKNKIKIDFKSSKFKELVKYLFYDDFRYFNYDFPI
jgi:hypothetical protein